MLRRTSILLLFLVTLIGAACVAPGAAAVLPSLVRPANPTALPSPADLPLATPAPSPSSSIATAGRLLFMRTGRGTAAEAIVAIAATTGQVAARLPVGVADGHWTVLYAAATIDGETTVTAYDPSSGATLRRISVPGSFALPVIVAGELPGGLASDGHTLVLVDQAPAPGSSRFALLDTTFATPARFVTLPGGFAFDALSPDARNLFLIEHLGPAASGHYQVRLYDTAAGALVPGAIVDKRNIGEAMEGRPVARVTSVDGQWVYTLYVKTDGTAFVHELDTTAALALCVDLPAAATATTAADVAAWRLGLRGTDPPYAANGNLGILVGLNPGTVRSTGRMPTGGTAGSAELAVAADGSALYLAGPGGVTTVSTSSFGTLGKVLPTSPLAGIAITDDGRSLYGVLGAGTGMVDITVSGPGVGSIASLPFGDLPAGDRIGIELLAIADGGR